MVSFSEGQIDKLIAKSGAALAAMHTRQFSRIYPSGIRIGTEDICLIELLFSLMYLSVRHPHRRTKIICLHFSFHSYLFICLCSVRIGQFLNVLSLSVLFLRPDSSNYDPVPSWNAGAQIVALNLQV
jgi:hypothetical protein